MKSLSQDISLTLVVKVILLLGLWYFCVHGKKAERLPEQQWFFEVSHLPKPAPIPPALLEKHR